MVRFFRALSDFLCGCFNKSRRHEQLAWVRTVEALNEQPENFGEEGIVAAINWINERKDDDQIEPCLRTDESHLFSSREFMVTYRRTAQGEQLEFGRIRLCCHRCKAVRQSMAYRVVNLIEKKQLCFVTEYGDVSA